VTFSSWRRSFYQHLNLFFPGSLGLLAPFEGPVPRPPCSELRSPYVLRVMRPRYNTPFLPRPWFLPLPFLWRLILPGGSPWRVCPSDLSRLSAPCASSNTVSPKWKFPIVSPSPGGVPFLRRRSIPWADTWTWLIIFAIRVGKHLVEEGFPDSAPDRSPLTPLSFLFSSLLRQMLFTVGHFFPCLFFPGSLQVPSHYRTDHAR